MEFPKWMYKTGQFGRMESKLFNSPEDVPEKGGWVESPADLKKKGKPNAE